MASKTNIINNPIVSSSSGKLTIGVSSLSSMDVIYYDTYGYLQSTNDRFGSYVGDDVIDPSSQLRLGSLQRLTFNNNFENDAAFIDCVITCAFKAPSVPSSTANRTLYMHVSNGVTCQMRLHYNNLLWASGETRLSTFTPIQPINVGMTYDVVWNNDQKYPFELDVFLHDINKRDTNSAASYVDAGVNWSGDLKQGSLVTVTFTKKSTNATVSSFAVYDRFGSPVSFSNASTNDLVYTFTMPDGPVHVCYSSNEVNPCLDADSLILMGDRSLKKLRDIRVGDIVATYDHDKGELSTKPLLWNLPINIANEYYRCEFDDGTVLNVVANHRVYSVDKRCYTRVTDLVEQEHVACYNRVIRLVKINVMHEKIAYSNAISYYDMNIFANGVLTGCGFNNIYQFDQDMKFVKMPREYRSINEFNISKVWYDGLRISEQYAPADQINKYVNDKVIS